MKTLWFGSAILAATVIAAPAYAQSQADFYVGAEVGYHDLGTNPFGDDSGVIYGTYVGVDLPIGEQLIIGIEGNYNLGTDAIDAEYGIAAKLGVRVGNGGQIFVRGGYQEVNFDLQNLIGVPVPGNVDDTYGDYLLGVGGQVMLSPNVSLRAVLDTIAFDSVRGTAGIALHF